MPTDALNRARGDKPKFSFGISRMPRAATKNLVCRACGADIRSEALFCYGCGEAVATSEEPPASLFETDSREKDNTRLSTIMETSSLEPETARDTPLSANKKPLTAAMLRRKRAMRRRPVEVEWREPEGSSKAFVVASVIFTIIAALILAAALYLK